MDRQGRQASASAANSRGLGRSGKPRRAAREAAKAKSPAGKMSLRSRPNSKYTLAVQGPKPAMAAMAATAASSDKAASPSAERRPSAKASARARAWRSFGRDRPACRKASSLSASSPSGLSAPGRAESLTQMAVAAWFEIICPHKPRRSPGKPASRRRQGRIPACSGMAASSGSNNANSLMARPAHAGASAARVTGCRSVIPPAALTLSAAQGRQLGKGVARGGFGSFDGFGDFLRLQRQLRPRPARIGVERER